MRTFWYSTYIMEPKHSHFHTVREWLHIAVALSLILLLVAGTFLLNPEKSLSATYTFLQTDWSGGVSGTTAVHPTNQTSWTYFSSSTNIDTTSTVGVATLLITSLTFSDTFTATTSKDTASTTATWSGGGNISIPSGEVTDLSSGFITAFGAGTAIESMDVDLVNGIIYMVGGTGSFVKYDIGANQFTDLSAQLGAATGNVIEVEFDSATGNVYVARVYGLLKYTPATATTTLAWNGLSNPSITNAISESEIDLTSRRIYFKGDWSETCEYCNSGNFFKKYDLDTGVVSTLATGAQTSWDLVVDETNGFIYGAESYPRFEKYTSSTNAWTTLDSYVPWSLATYSMKSLAFDATNNIIYMGSITNTTQSGKYNVGSATSTLLTSIVTPSWSGSVNSIELDTRSGSVYFAGADKRISKYNPSNNTATSVSAFFTAVGATEDFTSLLYVSTTDVLFAGGDGNFGYLSAPTTVTAQSLTVDSTANNISSVTLTKNDTPGTGVVTYYVTNNGGTNWAEVTAGEAYTFGTTGSDLRWKATLTGNATIEDITLAYSALSSSGTLISSAYDAGDAANLFAKISWTGSGTSTNETIKFQVRSSSDGNTWTGWCGYADTGSSCSGSNYFLDAQNGVTVATDHPLRNGANDRYLQYMATLAGSGATPTLSDVTVTYVVNAAPNFDASFGTNGLSVAQIATTSHTYWGRVGAELHIRDTDTLSGSTNAGYVTPSIEYNIGGGWQTATGVLYFNSTSEFSSSTQVVGNLPISELSYTTYMAIWDAQTQIPSTYNASAQLRVTLNDNEAASNIASSTGTTFILDTTAPSVASFYADASSDRLAFSLSDNSNLSYRFSNNSDLSSDGVNASSSSWTAVGGTSINTSSSWTLVGSPSYQTAYMQTRDIYGNTATTSIATAPSTPGNLDLKDIANIRDSYYREFIGWSIYTATDTAPFGSYKVYRSTDGSNYSLVSTINNSATNYYTDNLLSSSTTYYYKVAIVSSDGDISEYSAIVSDLPNGQGGTDFTPPSISSVVVTSTQSTWARILWTTDEVSNSVVQYSIQPSRAYGTSKSVDTMVTSHDVTLTGLTPNTAYYFQVKSTDPLNNEGSSDNSGSGYSFTTAGGPSITNVTASETSDVAATIFWNTDTDSDSYVVYSTNSSLTNPQTIGSASLVGSAGTSSLYQHRVSLTGLTAGLTYYYYVKSTDGDSNLSTDTNGGAYYSFKTTTDQKAPTISSLQAPVLSTNSAVVTWNTDEAATTKVFYGLSSSSLDLSTTQDSTLSISHVATLSSLSASTPYYYMARSQDAAGNSADSSTQTFTTTATGTVTIVTVSVGGGGYSGPVADTTPPEIKNIQVSDITPFAAKVSFETDEPTVGFVEYGRTAYDFSAGDSVFATKHTIKLEGLRLGASHQFRVKAVDKFGNTATLKGTNFTTLYFAEAFKDLRTLDNAAQFQEEIERSIESILPSILPPFIEKPAVADVSEDSATVTWRTNIDSYSVVSYATEDEYDEKKTNPYTAEVSDVTNKKSDHKLTLTGLIPNTRYRFGVKSFSLPQVVGKSQDLAFVTRAAKIQARIVEVKNDSIRVVWTTQEPATSIVEVKNPKTGEGARRTDGAKTTYHEMIVDGLMPATKYEAYVSGENEKGNLIEATKGLPFVTSKDTTAPIIGNIKIESVFIPGKNKAQAILTWTTDEPATTVIYYGEGPGSELEEKGTKVDNGDSWILSHVAIVSNLKPGTIYQVKLESSDPAGNRATFGPRSIITPNQTESIFDIIFKNFEEAFKFLRNVK